MSCNRRDWEVKTAWELRRPWHEQRLYLKSSDVDALWAFIDDPVTALSTGAVVEFIKARWPGIVAGIPNYLVYAMAAVLAAEIKWAKEEDEGCGVVVKQYYAVNATPVPAVNIDPQ